MTNDVLSLGNIIPSNLNGTYQGDLDRTVFRDSNFPGFRSLRLSASHQQDVNPISRINAIVANTISPDCR